MQRRSTPGCWVLLSVLAAVFAASCTENPESPPQIANLVRLAGDGQTAPIGSLLPLPLVVRVEDQHGVPLEGAVITFTVTTGSGGGGPGRRASAPPAHRGGRKAPGAPRPSRGAPPGGRRPRPPPAGDLQRRRQPRRPRRAGGDKRQQSDRRAELRATGLARR